MSTTSTPIKKEEPTKTPMDKSALVDNHKKAASHLEEAAKNHHDAAKHHQDGNWEKASASTLKANGHVAIAKDAQREDLKQHAMNHKATK